MIAAYKTFCRFEKYRTGEGGCWQVRCRPPFSSAYQKLTQHNEVSISIDKCLKQNSLSSQCIAHQKDIYSSTWRVLSFKIFNLLKTLFFFKICYSLKFLFFNKRGISKQKAMGIPTQKVMGFSTPKTTDLVILIYW